MPDLSGVCANTISDGKAHFPPDLWSDMQVGRFSMTAESFAEYQTFVESACELIECSVKQKKLRDKILKRMGNYGSESFK